MKGKTGTGLMDPKDKNTKYLWLAAFTTLWNEDYIEDDSG